MEGMKKAFFPLIILLLFLAPEHSFSAPHLKGLKPEPLVRIGQHLPERLAKKGQFFYAPSSYPATVNIILIRVEFQKEDPDDPSTTGDGTWSWCKEDTGCPNNDPDYWVTRAKARFINYWDEVSYGNLVINITVSPKVYTLSGRMADYGGETYRDLENFIYESISLADPDIDFNLYDAVLIVHAGSGEEADTTGDTPSDLWSLYYYDNCISLNNQDQNCLYADGKLIKEAIIMPQTDSQDGIVVDPLGVYLHEFGHWLGLPDLYCSATVCLLDGVGKWSLMGDGLYNIDPATCNGNACIYGSSPAHLDAWSKVYLGWIVPEEIRDDEVWRSLSPVENSPEVIKLQASTSNPREYLLLENRQKIGFDKGLPGEGLLVWLISEDVINQNINSNTINNNLYHPGIKLIEADGDWNLLKYGCSEGNDCGSPGDPFPGSTMRDQLAPVGNPSSRPYTPYGWVNLKGITENNGHVSLVIGFGPLPPENLTMSSKTLSWSPVSDAVLYRIYRNNAYLSETSATSYTDYSAQNGYIYNVTSVDSSQNESDLSDTVIAQGIGDGASGDDGGWCFIATAAYGSYLAPEVQVLREFRDRYLLTNAPGRLFVRLYYKYSPPLADLIREFKVLRFATILVLTPAVYTIKYPFILPFLLIIGVLWCKRKGRVHG